MVGAVTFLLGTFRGLHACATDKGVFSILALDHRQNLRRELRPDDPESVTEREMVEFKLATVRTLAPVASATLLDPEYGIAACLLDRAIPARSGLIVAIERTGYLGTATRRSSEVLEGWGVEQAKRTGVSAAKLLVYYHPDASNADSQERLVSSVHAACRAADLPLFLEVITYSPDTGARLSGDARRRAVVESAARLTTLGGDVLKVEFPCGPEEAADSRWADACAELDAATTIPWVLLSGGVAEDLFMDQAAAACTAGASGVVAGRSIWAGAAELPTAERDRYLATESMARLLRLTRLVDGLGRPWSDRSTAVSRQPEPSSDWFLGY